MKVYYDQDASFDSLSDKKIAVLGFGSQGHAHSLNLKESGLNVCVGLRKGSDRWEKAAAQGLEVKEIDEAAEWADVVMVLLPDQHQKAVYEKSIAPHLKEGDTLVFAHGFNIHYKWINPPKNINVMILILRFHLSVQNCPEHTPEPCSFLITKFTNLQII